jgi:hypothetical protein
LPKNYKNKKKKKESKPPKKQAKSKEVNIPVERNDQKKLTNFEALLSILHSSKDYVNKLNKNRGLNSSQALNGECSQVKAAGTSSGHSGSLFKRLSTHSSSNKSSDSSQINLARHQSQYYPHLKSAMNNNSSSNLKLSHSNKKNQRNSLNINRNSSYISDKIDFFLTNTNTNEILYNKDHSKSESSDLNRQAVSGGLTMTNASAASTQASSNNAANNNNANLINSNNKNNDNNNNSSNNVTGLAKKRQSGSFSIKQVKQQNRLSKKSLEESFESIDQLNSKRKSVYSICSEDRSITIVHIKSGDNLCSASDNFNNALNNTMPDTDTMFTLGKECPLTLEQIINQHDSIVVGGGQAPGGTTTTSTNRKSIIIIETNNSANDQLIASILESTSNATTVAALANNDLKRNSKYLEEASIRRYVSL